MSTHEVLTALTGKNMTCWSSWEQVRTGFPGQLVDILTDAGFAAPTTIQSYVWPALMEKEDIIGVAKTGSGKTLAFLLPAFIHIKIQEAKKRATR